MKNPLGKPQIMREASEIGDRPRFSNPATRVVQAEGRMQFRIEYASATITHLKALTARQQSIVLDRAAQYLSVDPMVETRNRKRMRPNPLAPWELRFGNLRVYFDVVIEPEPFVVLAVGVKERNAVRIEKAVIDL